MGDNSNQDFQEDSVQESNKKTWIFVGIVLGIIIIGLLIFFFVKSSLEENFEEISNKDLSNGTYSNLEENIDVLFEIDEREHKLLLDALHDDSIDITIRSKPISVNIKIGETKKFDLDGDGKYDLMIRLVNIKDNKPRIYIKEIDEVIKNNLEAKREEVLEKAREFLPDEEFLILEEAINNASTIEVLNELETSIDDFLDAVEAHLNATEDYSNETCVKDWQCSDWEDCVNNTQKRLCLDFNDCGTIEDKPEEKKDCEIQTIDCGTDFNCFIEASENCGLAQLYWTYSADIFNMISTSTTFIELRGIESNKCIYYQKTESNSVRYSDELVQQLLNGGATQGEIDQAEQEANESAQNTVGTGLVCSFDINDLTLMLERWKDGNITSGFHCDGYECVATGDFEYAECEQFVNHDENCHIVLNIHTPSLLNGGEGFARVIGFSEEDNVFWIIGNSSVATINPQQGSFTTITTVGIGNTSITATDTGIGTHCKVSFELEVL